MGGWLVGWLVGWLMDGCVLGWWLVNGCYFGWLMDAWLVGLLRAGAWLVVG